MFDNLTFLYSHLPLVPFGPRGPDGLSVADAGDDLDGVDRFEAAAVHAVVLANGFDCKIKILEKKSKMVPIFKGRWFELRPFGFLLSHTRICVLCCDLIMRSLNFKLIFLLMFPD